MSEPHELRRKALQAFRLATQVTSADDRARLMRIGSEYAEEAERMNLAFAGNKPRRNSEG